MSTILVCGGRAYFDFATLDRMLELLVREGDTVVHGDAPGADSMAGTWASLRGRTQRAFPADWKAHGKAAGPKRNRQMLDEAKPDLVVAFPGGRGTDDMVSKAKARGVPVVRVEG